jgi:hypothetical protein
MNKNYETTSDLEKLNLVTAIIFMCHDIYINIIVGLYTAIISTIMFIVTMEGPSVIIERLENSSLDIVFTFRGRYLLDIAASLFLFAMGWMGIIAAGLTCFLIFGIRLVGVRHPDAFNELFRPPMDDDQSDTVVSRGSEYESTR